MPERASAISSVIKAELRLLDPAVRACADRLAELLHPDFREFGASGRERDRGSIVAALTAKGAPGPRPITTSKMRGVQLAPGVVLLTFDTEFNGLRAHRSSVWRLTESGWRLYFHQGTPFG
ncbi:DUF4440 domain-containing protein [Streptomyces lushanensis]|uniref:nuclear transport factor 2 family protein n=1 Tax=Streptomyces lushanensis TaxID=1434255 RepID=UPI000836392D|nr:DUF4440 domain-containing protein [Streptomyces lushanensis]